ncbi:16S rRNA (adenine(1518)-N(6)/adenine(1519)-N(6))-dimethyltransferase RsmA [Chitinimonas sp. BJB300]|uniref:16S rRNA (adenine(1518)-N(6)/adenine(1519)-N(6))- dimethyltransferase RsmA n=1 Tax=Chitinimonas sp. BJB300 TaxID=1559339 RepID=UPI000C0F03CB|nr:16S rRNA (adenine(1518)-N(6)/adenine(1519)-N(6))-dimethyltransferase RsmA [Chitinimonas sp. BJB300]PHV12378.1 16S rRNA (adenine(1518)-N(6)/adenine(1519)-N(6))-dimethyltransferase [Chitinimonas sp. BJB300]TSJ91088.1 16S rRNA (adenine(1518)-N(6)/adenine(1519)-N(6))-dimethyltransferase RsmA [Chitinimonas sp. BJB300]
MKPHTPRKRFGQNFLQDQGVINDIISCIHPQPNDAMVEIGPGLAALTQPLLTKINTLHAVEIDRDIVANLTGRFSADKLVIHNFDALKFDFGSLADQIAPGGQIRLVGNLPYNISTPLLFHLAGFAPQVNDCHFMLQNEVVLRMVAEPSNADYGRLSVMLQYHFHMEKLLDVPPDAFFPPPKVDSAIVRMIPRPFELQAADPAALEKLVAQAFSQRRKTLRNNLKGIVSDDDFAALDIDSSIRPENLPVRDYVRLVNYLHTPSGALQQDA